MLALFRLIDRGHDSGFMQKRGGKLFDEGAFLFLMGKRTADEEDKVPSVSDGCIHRVLESLMMVNAERLSYRTLDVEQIGSVYETVMGFTAKPAEGRSLAIKAGKNNKTPVYVDLEALLAVAGKDREKEIKETTWRGQLPAGVKRDLKEADSVAALAAALGQIADERGSPRGEVSPAGTPILQPTDERRRTGSHYTPRSLTAPIVTHALEPAFAKLGAEATPEAVLSLKVCDPACGSGAFLVEATRQIGARLVLAWEAHPKLKPPIPADEDDELHARRLVAQRCIYGVDRNPMATDLAKLSLWLATLARDHEFSFLDHALKSGDSLVGLSKQQLSGGSWDNAPVRNTLIGQTVSERVEKLAAHRDAIRNAPDDVALAMQESRHAIAEKDAEHVRLIGNAIIAAFFKHDKPKQRFDEVRYVTAMAGTSNWWDGLRNIAASLDGGAHPIHPFHWEIEFPEVFARDNPGFDAIIGNPPFAGKNTTIAGNRAHYLEWLQTLHTGAHGNADLVAHFFRRAFGLIRQGGCFGLIATNTIGQGDTRETGLCAIIAGGGAIAHAVKRLKWPGEAAVVVSVVHVVKGEADAPTLDGRDVRRVSAYLVEGDLDGSPSTLEENAGKSFQGSILLGMGFTFDDVHAAKGNASTLAEMDRLITKEPRNAEIIKPFLGWAEVSNSPMHAYHRHAVDFGDRPLERLESGTRWSDLTDDLRRQQLRDGVVAPDYPGEVARDWPDLIEIVERLVKPDRDKQTRDALRDRWWQYGEKRPGLYGAIDCLARVVVTSSQAAAHLTFAWLPANLIYSSNLNVFTSERDTDFCALSSRIHEVWALAFGSTMKDDPTYTIDLCFKPFPFPPGYDSAPALEAAGAAYHAHRAAMMIATDKGMTKTYNRFHDPADTKADIADLRRLHAAMDDAVLRAYGWDDLANRAAGDDAPRFLTEDDEDDHKYQKRLFWPAPFRDELLALGLKDARQDEHGLVFATIPGNVPGAPTIAFNAHVDTNPENSGKDVN
ncbi:MAG: DNA methyltransferase, partial [Sphingopyxis sp.]